MAPPGGLDALWLGLRSCALPKPEDGALPLANEGGGGSDLGAGGSLGPTDGEAGTCG